MFKELYNLNLVTSKEIVTIFIVFTMRNQLIMELINFFICSLSVKKKVSHCCKKKRKSFSFQPHFTLLAFFSLNLAQFLIDQYYTCMGQTSNEASHIHRNGATFFINWNKKGNFYTTTVQIVKNSLYRHILVHWWYGRNLNRLGFRFSLPVHHQCWRFRRTDQNIHSKIRLMNKAETSSLLA